MNDVNSPSTRNPMTFASGANIVLGIWLVVSPWIIGYTSQAMLWNNIIVGAAVVVFGWMRVASQIRATVPGWINVVLGAWLIIAPFLFGASAGQRWNAVIVGALVIILALVSGGAGVSRRAQP